MVNLAQKSQSEETSNFSPKSWTSHFAKKAKKKLFFYQNISPNPFYDQFGRKKVTGKKFQISDQSYGLTPFPKMQILQFFNINLMFL